MTKPTEPTLTCSEVVERLANEAATEIMKKRHNLGYGFITTVAEDTEIIKRVFIDWRERRVQELEEIVELSLQAWQYGAYFGEWDEKQAAKWQIEGDSIKQKLHRAVSKLAESRGLTCKQFGAGQEGREA